MSIDLAVFDIDGTLTQTTGVDGDCYIAALGECFGITQIDPDWSKYRHTTDTAILCEIFETQLGRQPSASEQRMASDRVTELLAQCWADEPHRFSEMPGAADLLNHLRAQDQWRVAIATGASRSSASFKLNKTRLPWSDLPIACSEDGPSREQIVGAAISRSVTAQPGYRRVVSIGDGIWDLRTAASLKLPFVGIARGRQAEVLISSGASWVLPDFSDLDATLAALTQAEVPDYSLNC